MCILNWDIMTSNSHYCESRWYLGLGRNDLDSLFYTRDLHIIINMGRLTGPFPAICGYVGNPKSSKITMETHDIKHLNAIERFKV